MFNNKGLTMIELLVVIALISMVFVIISPFLSTSVGQNELISATWEVSDALTGARTMAMNGREDSGWSVHFESNKAVLFKGSAYNPSDPDNNETELNGFVSISQINLNGGASDVRFEKIKGKTQDYGTIIIEDLNTQETSTIEIGRSGRIK